MRSIFTVGPMRGLAVGVACLAAVCTADAKVVYVNGAITTPGDGTTWNKAFKYLRDALDTTLAGDQIYLAKGTYYPDDGKTGLFGDRELTFELDGQQIYGGFVGTETSFDQRDPVLNPTILSGAIWSLTGEDVYWSLHVTVAYESSTLDGVTVEQGNASGSDSWNYPGVAFYDEGGGCYVSAGKTLTLNTCIFRDNRALALGGAIRVADSTGKVVATDCVFDQNKIPLFDISAGAPSGGAIKGNVTATNCKFTGNTVVAAYGNSSTANGGAIDGDVTATLSEFTANTVSAVGNNSIATGGAIIGTVTASKCTFTGNTATSSVATAAYSAGGAINGGSLRAVDCVFSANTSGKGVINTDLKGSGGGGALFIEGGNSTVTNCVFVKNTSLVRGGAIQGASEGHSDSLTIANCTFLDNGVATTFKGSALSCAGIVRIVNNIFWNTAATAGAFTLSNQIHVIPDGILRNTDVFYPTPATVAQNVVKGGIAGVTQDGGADVFIGNPTDTLPSGDPLFVSAADPDGADDIWRTADDGLRLSTGSSALGTARDPRVTTFRNFLPADILDVDDDTNITELLPADIASFVRVQSTYVDMGAYEFGPLTHLPEVSVEQPVGIALVDGTALVDFGTNPGTTTTKVFTVRNTGPANLNRLALTLTGANMDNYTITQPSANILAPGATTTFTVSFKASSVAGVRTASVHLASNDADENPFDINLTGEALVPEIAIEHPVSTNLEDGISTISYGTVAVQSSVTKVFTIRNVGLGNLDISSVSSTGTNASEFKVTQPASKLLVAGATTTFNVTFSPTAAGARSASIIVNSNDPDAESSFLIKVTGNATVAPEIAVYQPSTVGLFDGGSKSFGKVKTGLAYTKEFTIKNLGSSALTNIDVTVSGTNAKLFTIVKPTATSIAPGGKTKFSVTFKPNSVGAKSATLKIISNDLDENPFDISLSGTGFSGSSASARSSLVSASVRKAAGSGAVTVTESKDGVEYLVLTVTKTPDWELSKHTAEVSPNLVDWFSGKKHTTTLVDNAEILRVRDNTPLEKGVKRFIRIK